MGIAELCLQLKQLNDDVQALSERITSLEKSQKSFEGRIFARLEDMLDQRDNPA
jgi:chaperonin cofactor prefoldin